MKSDKLEIMIRKDTTIKYLYQTVEGKKWLDNLIKATIGIDLTDFRLVYNELPGGNNKRKDMRLDFLLENDQDVVIIEVQNSKHDANKGYLYLARIISNGMKKSESYSDYLQGKKTLISINNFLPENNEKIRKEKPLYVHIQMGNAEYNYYKDFEDAYEILLPNSKEICYNDFRKEWRLFLCNNLEEMEKNATSDSKGIINVIKDLEMNGDFLSEYEEELASEALHEGIKIDGIIEGTKLGEKNKQLEIAKTMKLRGMDIKEIAEITQLTQEEIEKL